MVDRVGGPRGPQETNRKKKTSNADRTDGPSFGSMLESASGVDEAQPAQPAAPTTPVQNHLINTPQDEIVPDEPQERGKYILDQLEELERDILISSPTEAVNKLKKALETAPQGAENLNPKQQQILDEIDMRAAVEIAKSEVEE